MPDHELKKILLETCPVRPGQEERAWASLRDRLDTAGTKRSRRGWLYFPIWRGALAGLAVICGLVVLGNAVAHRLQPVSFASADSEAPGIFATSFYSSSAQAQVVWLDGLDAATDQPTYLDPTTAISRPLKKSSPAKPLNTL
jgi:hypothetical protein